MNIFKDNSQDISLPTLHPKPSKPGKEYYLSKRKIRSEKRIGPHNYDILSIIFGSLLGDGYAEKRIIGNGTRICFYQEGKHLAYLTWLHKLISNLGYCNPQIPVIQTRLGKKGIVRKTVRFSTWTYTSFNWIHELWYIRHSSNSCEADNWTMMPKAALKPASLLLKIVPKNIDSYFTPLALAIWIMDDGVKVGTGLKLARNTFSYEDCLYLVKILYVKYDLKASVQSAGVINQYHIYIWKESMPKLREIVLPFIHPSMKYKII